MGEGLSEQTGSLFPIDEEPPPPRAPLSGEFAHVALNRPLDCEFTYEVPPELREGAVAGARVAVQFGRKREVGVIVGLDTSCDLPPARQVRYVRSSLHRITIGRKLARLLPQTIQ